MASIGRVDGAARTTIPRLAEGAGLDGETILLYCSAQLNDLNGEIKARMAQQRRVRDAKSKINEISVLLNRHPDGAKFTPEEKRAILTAYAEAIKAMPPGGARDNMLKSLHSFRATTCYNDNASDEAVTGPFDIDGYLDTGIEADINVDPESPRNAMDAKEVKARLDELNGVGEDLNKDAELEMIGLQQLISQRQMAIQMATSLMNKYNQSLETIVSNYK